MSFAVAYRFSGLVMIAAGFLAAGAAGALPAPLLVLGSAAWIAAWFLDTARLRRAVPRWFGFALAAASLTLLLLEIFRFSQSVAAALCHLTLILASWKLLTRTSDRDDALLYFLSFVALLAAAALTLDPMYLALLLLFLISGVATIVLFEMKRSGARALQDSNLRPLVVPGRLRGSGLDLFAGFPAGHLAMLTAALVATIAALAAPLFFLLPRALLNVYRPPAPANRLVSGFSETVELGAVGTIEESRVAVMKVRVEAPSVGLPADLKWRGIALDRFDGRTWRRGRVEHHRVPMQAAYYKLVPSTSGTDFLSQTFYLEPMATDVVFGSHRMLAVTSDLGPLEQDALDNVFSGAPRAAAARYTAVSEISRPDPRLIQPLPWRLPPAVAACCLDAGDTDPRIGALARRVTAAARSPYETAQALEIYLRSAYGYSLELQGAPGSSDPLARFLFDVRRGHCEYFASAMAVMLRHLGIPSRLVNGYRAGEFNPWSGHWTVRQKNAHSWVEAYFPPYGWVEFDPTPADPASDEAGLLPAVARFFDALDLWWSADVVNYDLRRQSRLVEAARTWFQGFGLAAMDFAGAAGREIRGGTGRVQIVAREQWPITLILAMAAVLLALGARYRMRAARIARRWLYVLRPGARGGNRYALVKDIYLEASGLLKNRGWERTRSQTPAEFARQLEREPFGESFSMLTAIYNQSRFGRLTRDGDQSQALALLRALRRAPIRRASEAKSRA